MMGRQEGGQGQFFYVFDLEVPLMKFVEEGSKDCDIRKQDASNMVHSMFRNHRFSVYRAARHRSLSAPATRPRDHSLKRGASSAIAEIPARVTTLRNGSDAAVRSSIPQPLV